MKLIPFSRDLCRDLIKNGYSHFAIRQAEQPKDDYSVKGRRVTYKAIRQPAEMAIPITKLLEEAAAVEDGSYVMVAE
jgi:hypothetical protein